MYFARETWFIDTLKYKQTMIDLNQDSQVGARIMSAMGALATGSRI